MKTPAFIQRIIDSRRARQREGEWQKRYKVACKKNPDQAEGSTEEIER